jgi:hypothetical protein
MKADDWDTEMVYEHCKKVYGGGDYRCQTFRATGAMYKPFEFTIDYRFKGTLDDKDIKVLQQTGGDSSMLMFKMFETMRNQGQQDGLKPNELITMMEKMNGKSEQSNMMMMTLMIKSMESSQNNMMTMMSAILPALMGNRPADTNGPLLLELIKQKQEHHPMKDTLEMMATIKEIFDPKANKEEEEPDDMWSKLAKLAGPVVKGLMNGQPQQPLPTVTTEPPTGQPAPEPQPAKPSDLPQYGGLYMLMPTAYKSLFAMAIAAAEKGGDVGLYADIILDQLDENGMRLVQQTLTGSDWCAKLLGDENAVAHVRPWLEELRRIILNPNGTTTNIPTGQPDTASNPAGGRPA